MLYDNYVSGVLEDDSLLIYSVSLDAFCLPFTTVVDLLPGGVFTFADCRYA